MMAREIIDDYMKDRTIGNRRDFFEAVHTCGYLLDCRAMTDRGPIIRRFLHARVRSASYVKFPIPKKAGGVRIIRTSIKPLKEVQRAVEYRTQTDGPAVGGRGNMLFNRLTSKS